MTGAPVRRHRGYPIASAAALAALSTALFGVASARAGQAAPEVPTRSASAFQGEQDLFAVSAISSTDVWAVGHWQRGAGIPFAQHWDGTSWARMTVPVFKGPFAGLYDVAAVSSDDVWAVAGQAGRHGLRSQIVHWDGAAWTVVPDVLPPHTTESALQSITATGASDVWAAGWAETTTGTLPLLEHWNGKAWALHPDSPRGAGFEGVTMIQPGNGWAVGFDQRGTLALHEWQGVWRRVSTPDPGPRGTSPELLKVSGVGPQNVWALGQWMDGQGLVTPFFEHWDGRSWTVFDDAHSNPTECPMRDIDAVSSADVWAVGSCIRDGENDPQIEHWDGRSWSEVSSPNVRDAELYGVVGFGSTDAWAVGASQYEGSSPGPLVERWNGSYWTTAHV